MSLYAIQNRVRGFTLIELLVVVGIIGVLAAIVLVAVGGNTGKSRYARRASDMKTVGAALEVYYSTHGEYPNCSTSPYDKAGSDAGMGCVATALSDDGLLTTFPRDPQYPSKFYNYDRWCRTPSSSVNTYRMWVVSETDMNGLDDNWWGDNYVGSTNCIDPS